MQGDPQRWRHGTSVGVLAAKVRGEDAVVGPVVDQAARKVRLHETRTTTDDGVDCGHRQRSCPTLHLEATLGREFAIHTHAPVRGITVPELHDLATPPGLPGAIRTQSIERQHQIAIRRPLGQRTRPRILRAERVDERRLRHRA